MLYAVDTQTVPAGTALNFTDNVVNSPAGAIALSGTDGLTLGTGQYLVTFVSDLSITEAGDGGAALALDGAALPYAASSIFTSDTEGGRTVLSAIVTVPASGVLTVINNSTNAVSYENSTLTVVRLA